jgi:hypothetical protein
LVNVASQRLGDSLELWLLMLGGSFAGLGEHGGRRAFWLHGITRLAARTLAQRNAD